MKKALEAVYCSDCGNEIPEEELAFLSGSSCAICAHMRLEAIQMICERRELMSRNPQWHSQKAVSVNPQ
ncbi:MAG: hypothetical protein PHH11_15030 [Methylomonas sp.]|nr:hypothetical protein [Methylomonas sp.]